VEPRATSTSLPRKPPATSVSLLKRPSWATTEDGKEGLWHPSASSIVPPHPSNPPAPGGILLLNPPRRPGSTVCILRGRPSPASARRTELIGETAMVPRRVVPALLPGSRRSCTRTSPPALSHALPPTEHTCSPSRPLHPTGHCLPIFPSSLSTAARDHSVLRLRSSKG
jgi:hypothetical protein